MQVTCPECGKVGLLQKITPRYYRIRHSVNTWHIAEWTKKQFKKRTFTYCRVLTEWAEEQVRIEKLREAEELRKILYG
jgi:hypothetical protein